MARGQRRRALVVLLVGSLVVLSASLAIASLARGGRPSGGDPTSLRALSAAAGCRLVEVFQARPTNPPTSGEFRERDRVRDGDYSQAASPPPLRSVMHALEHGRVLLQYRRHLPAGRVGLLRRLHRERPRKTLLFENQTGMHYEVAAVAYLSAVVCPRFGDRALPALRAFRERRIEFGQGQ